MNGSPRSPDALPATLLSSVLCMLVLGGAPACQSGPPADGGAGVDSDNDVLTETGAPVETDEAGDAPVDTDPPWTATAEPCTAPGALGTCTVAGWEDRPVEVLIPDALDLSRPTPVVLALHGGGGSAFTGLAITCPPNARGRADLTHPDCLTQAALSEEAVLVAPSGTDVGGAGSRTWNAGGGREGWHCVSGGACLAGIDDVAYLDAVLDAVGTWANVDPDATFAVGLSNGGAMVHRYACERSSRVSAIASVGAANQYATLETCSPSSPVAVLHVHGDADACWTFEESSTSCGPGRFGRRVGVLASAQGWADRLACTGSETLPLEPDVDGAVGRTEVTRWSGCTADVALWRLRGHGHTWPNGLQYQPADEIGPTDRDWGASRIVAWGLGRAP